MSMLRWVLNELKFITKGLVVIAFAAAGVVGFYWLIFTYPYAVLGLISLVLVILIARGLGWIFS